jgi:hypothetical protein
MKQITKNFTYDLPDEYLAQTNADGKTATASYTGPEKLWVFVDETTRENKSDAMQIDENWDDNGMPAPTGQTKVELDCKGADTLLCAIFLPHSVTLSQTNVAVDLPEGYGTYVHAVPTLPDHTYERELLKYKPDTATVDNDNGDNMNRGGEWELTWKQPWVTWATMTQTRNDQLAMSDSKVSFDQPDSVKGPWVEWRQKMRDMPTVWKRGEADEFPAHMVKFPIEPTRGGFSDPPAPGPASDPNGLQD